MLIRVQKSNPSFKTPSGTHLHGGDDICSAISQLGIRGLVVPVPGVKRCRGGENNALLYLFVVVVQIVRTRCFWLLRTCKLVRLLELLLLWNMSNYNKMFCINAHQNMIYFLFHSSDMLSYPFFLCEEKHCQRLAVLTELLPLPSSSSAACKQGLICPDSAHKPSMGSAPYASTSCQMLKTSPDQLPSKNKTKPHVVPACLWYWEPLNSTLPVLFFIGFFLRFLSLFLFAVFCIFYWTLMAFYCLVFNLLYEPLWKSHG